MLTDEVPNAEIKDTVICSVAGPFSELMGRK
jgi:hypothetical protein